MPKGCKVFRLRSEDKINAQAIESLERLYEADLCPDRELAVDEDGPGKMVVALAEFDLAMDG